MRGLRTGLLAAAFALMMVAMHAAPRHAPSAAMASAPDARSGQAGGHGDASSALRAARELERLAATHAHLDGVTVTVGATPKGEQAVAYYTSGRIVIDRNHRASIEDILAHEIWHVIDWRDNGRVDWGEDVPPAGAAAYLQP